MSRPLCKDCKHTWKPLWEPSWADAVCKHPDAAYRDLVTGESGWCRDERAWPRVGCGREGALFEAKAPAP